MARFVHTLLLLCAATLLHAQSLRIAQAEWFTGNDPGEGLGIAMQVADGAWDEAVEEVIASLPSGMPGNVVVSVRVKGANGYWSSAYRQVVHTGSSVPGRQARVQAGEYFWDSDPGVGNATPLLALDGDFNSALEQAIASDNTITPGAHRLFVRIQGADNGWSALFTQVVQVNTAITARDIRVQQGEFFFDSDPGEGTVFRYWPSMAIGTTRSRPDLPAWLHRPVGSHVALRPYARVPRAPGATSTRRCCMLRPASRYVRSPCKQRNTTSTPILAKATRHRCSHLMVTSTARWSRPWLLRTSRRSGFACAWRARARLGQWLERHLPQCGACRSGTHRPRHPGPTRRILLRQ
jgi:hypothetical protein